MKISCGVVTSTGSVSTLTFSPLAASHAGTYTCEVKVGSLVRTSSINITVAGKHSRVSDQQHLIISDLNLQIQQSLHLLMRVELPQLYSLTCDVFGTERLTDADITYYWLKDGYFRCQTRQMRLSFLLPSLSLILECTINCNVTVMSSFISSPIITPSTASSNITLRCKS